MKKLIAVAVLATTTTLAFAADRAIYDVQYLPNAGTTYGQTQWDWTQMKLEADSGDADTDGWTLTQTVGHSFTDRFSLEGSINYTDMTTDPDGGSKTDTTGISDPTLQARYRVMDEAWRWDILGGATIGLGDSKTKSNGDSDNRQGGSDLFLGTQIGQKSENLQWAVLAQYNSYMKATSKTSGQPKVKDDAHGQWTLGADLLNKLSEKGYLRSHITGVWTPDYDDNQNGTTASSATWNLGTQYQHMFSQDLLAYGGVNYQMINTASGQIDDFNAWILTLGARYQF
jgi:long-subunit fatty acid transport protein